MAGANRDGYFTNIQELILEQGVAFYGPGEPLTDDEVELLLKVSRWATFKQRECFYNAQRIAALSDQIKYWEGYAQGSIAFPVHHAWVTINDKVVDLTWKFHGAKSRVNHDPCPDKWEDRFAVGTFPEDAVYLGVEIDASDALRRMVDRGACYSYLDDWEEGFPLLRRDAWV